VGGWVDFGMTKRIFIMLFLAGCAPQLDYFGNPIKLHEDIISLTKMRKDPSEKDKYYLTFIEIYNASNAQVLKKERTLDRYLDSIMKKLYQRFMELNIKSAREKAKRRGLNFNEKLFIKKQEAVLPILFFYGIVILLGFILPGVVTIVPSWIFFAICSRYH